MGNDCCKGDTSAFLVVKHKIQINDTIISIVHGDITAEETEIIVNSANTKLAMGGGLAAVIVSRAGIEVQKEATGYIKENGDAEPGEVIVTGSGQLKCQKLFHAVPPVYENGENNEDGVIRGLLMKIYTMVEEGGYTSLSIPALGTGIHNYPKEYFAIILFDTITQYLSENPNSIIKEIHLTNIDVPAVTYISREFVKRFAEFGEKIDLRLNLQENA